MILRWILGRQRVWPVNAAVQVQRTAACACADMSQVGSSAKTFVQFGAGAVTIRKKRLLPGSYLLRLETGVLNKWFRQHWVSQVVVCLVAGESGKCACLSDSQLRSVVLESFCSWETSASGLVTSELDKTW